MAKFRASSPYASWCDLERATRWGNAAAAPSVQAWQTEGTFVSFMKGFPFSSWCNSSPGPAELELNFSPTCPLGWGSLCQTQPVNLGAGALAKFRPCYLFIFLLDFWFLTSSYPFWKLWCSQHTGLGLPLNSVSITVKIKRYTRVIESTLMEC